MWSRPIPKRIHWARRVSGELGESRVGLYGARAAWPPSPRPPHSFHHFLTPRPILRFEVLYGHSVRRGAFGARRAEHDETATHAPKLDFQLFGGDLTPCVSVWPGCQIYQSLLGRDLDERDCLNQSFWVGQRSDGTSCTATTRVDSRERSWRRDTEILEERHREAEAERKTWRVEEWSRGREGERET